MRAFGVSLVLAIAAAHVLEAAGLVDSPLLIGIVLAATAFGIVVAVLKDAGETRTDFGQLVITGASVADFGTVVLLSLFFSAGGVRHRGDPAAARPVRRVRRDGGARHAIARGSHPAG